MLTLLTVDEKESSVFRKKLLRCLPVNRIKTEYRASGERMLRHIHYINRNGRINYQKIAKRAGEDRFRILFDGDLLLKNKHIAPFIPTAFRARLCVNMGLAVLESMKELPKSFRVGLYDPLGEAVDAAERIVEFTDNFTVVTKSIPLYGKEAERLMWEKGVSLRVSRRASSISQCDLIIAPSKLREKFSTKSKAVILTCDCPSFPLLSRVYYRYDLKLPQNILPLCPEGFDAELLAGGLYSIWGVYALGSLVPLLAVNGRDTQTYISLSRYFLDIFSS